MPLIRDGDELVVVKFNRPGRSTREIPDLRQGLEGRDAALAVLEPAFSTRGGIGPILATVLGTVAETERTFIRERRQARIEPAKKAGVYKGRTPSMPMARVREMRAAGLGLSAIAKALGIGRMSVYRALTASAARHLPRKESPAEARRPGTDREA
jgi:DNA invertase Pin-like site-specific DNA recombinase